MSITINKPLETFKILRVTDPNLNDSQLQATRDFKFDANIPINNLLVPGPINIDGEEWDFEWNNGMRSLARRGFYTIIGNLQLREILNFKTNKMVPTWSADVLYTPRSNYGVYFKFFANVGPLINVNGIGFNLSSKPAEKIITSKLPDHTTRNKEQFFKSMQNRVFYVSQQSYVDTFLKQTIWVLF